GASKAPSGNKMEIQTGVYNEKVTIQTNLTLTSAGGPARIGFNSTRKVSQLTGEDDKELCGALTKSKTQSNYQLNGEDLGVPVEYRGRIYFLFGDTFSANPEESKEGDPYKPLAPRSRDSDSVAWVYANDDPEQKLKLRFLKEGDAPGNEESPGLYHSPKV